jgi:hypothetical protein
MYDKPHTVPTPKTGTTLALGMVRHLNRLYVFVPNMYVTH